MEIRQALVDSYGFILEEELIDEIIVDGHVRSISAGEVLIEYGQNIKYMPLLID